jgi:tetratricopeptide (TPR) repeat protein
MGSMRLRYRKSFKIAPGVRVNLSKSGIGVSAGKKGARVGVGPRGAYTSVGIPGTGIYGIHYFGKSKRKPKSKSKGSSASQIGVEERHTDEQPVSVLEPPRDLQIPNELSSQVSPLGCLVFLLGVGLVIYKPLLGTAVIIAAGVISSRTGGSRALQLYQQARKCVKKGDLEGATTNLRQVLDLQPNLLETKSHLGMLYFHQKRYPEAANMFGEYLQNKYNNTIDILRAYSYYLSGNLEKALDTLQSFPERYKEETGYTIMLGGLFLDMGKPDLALEVLKNGPTRKRKMDESMAAFRYLLGRAYFETGDKKRALTQFNQVYIYNRNFRDVAEYIEQL